MDADYDFNYADWLDYGAYDVDGPLESDAEESDNDDNFNILDDIDTVLFFRVNSFVHSVTGHELGIHHPYVEGHDTNQSVAGTKLAQDERTDYASSKIN